MDPISLALAIIAAAGAADAMEASDRSLARSRKRADQIYAEVYRLSDEVREYLELSWEELGVDDPKVPAGWQFAAAFARRLPELSERLGREVLGSGAGRVVVRVGPDVLKLAYVPFFGVRQNLSEVAAFAVSEGKRWRKFLLPVLDSDPHGRWVRMPMANAVSPSYEDQAELRDTARCLKRAIASEPDLFVSDPDVAKRNFGMYNGRVVLVDYGILVREHAPPGRMG